MTGLALSRAYYLSCGRGRLEADFPALFPRMAVGLAGEGSECFGFDDALSRDHDWGPGFCIWLEEADFAAYGPAVQAVYDALPSAFEGYPPRREHPLAGARVGVLSTQRWYRHYTGLPSGPQTLEQWRRTPEAALATATNGAVFQDASDCFSALRRRLLDFYPEDVRIKKLVARAAAMAQAGQYNLPRCLRRGERVAAQLALAEFTRAGLSMVYLLNRRYAPFYKWMHRGVRDLPRLPQAYKRFASLSLAADGPQQEALVDAICADTVAELRRQGLTESPSTFLLDHCGQMMTHIGDVHLRSAHILEE